MNNKLKALFVEKGITQQSVADALNVTLAAVCQAIGGHNDSRRVKEKAAEMLGITYDQLNSMWQRSPLPLKANITAKARYSNDKEHKKISHRRRSAQSL